MADHADGPDSREEQKNGWMAVRRAATKPRVDEAGRTPIPVSFTVESIRRAPLEVSLSPLARATVLLVLILRRPRMTQKLGCVLPNMLYDPCSPLRRYDFKSWQAYKCLLSGVHAVAPVWDSTMLGALPA